MVRSPQDLSEDPSSHLLPSLSSHYDTELLPLSDPIKEKQTSFSCPQHRKRCTESTKLGCLSVISCFKERDLCSDAGNFKHWGWRWRTQEQVRSPNPRHAGTRWARGAGVAELSSGRRDKEGPGPRGAGPGDPAGRRGVNTNPLPRRPHFRLTASPEDGPTHPGDRDVIRGPDTNQALLDPVTDPHNREQNKERKFPLPMSFPGRPSPPTTIPVSQTPVCFL